MATRSRSPRCISCGCTETHACMVSVGGLIQGCAWILVDREKGEGLCSSCATARQLVYAYLVPEDALGLQEDGRTAREIAGWTGRAAATVWRALVELEAVGLAERGGVLSNHAQVWYRTVPS